MVTPNTGSLVRRGFTLIELIIVVTILAILATIAFTQFGSVSGTARDTKRRSDLSQIRDAITKKDSLESYTLSSFVSPLVATTVTWSTVYVAGVVITNTGTLDYTAGTIKFDVLGLKESEFKDPKDLNYRIGQTKLSGKSFEVAASLENEGIPKAFVAWTYNPRKTAPTFTSPSYNSTDDILTVNVADLGKLRKGDRIGFGSASGVVLSISENPNTIKIGSITWTEPDGVTTVTFSPEVPGLIKAKESTCTESGSGVVTDSTVCNPY